MHSFNKYLIFLILFIIVVLNIFLNIALNDCRQSKNLMKKTYNEPQVSYMEMKLNLQISKSINKRVCDTLLNKRSKLFLFFNGKGCYQCVERIIMNLNVLADSIKDDKIILVGDFNNINSLNDHLYFCENNFKKVIVKDLIFGDEIKIDEPVLFIMEPNYNIRFVYLFSDKEFDIKLYFKDIIKEYFKGKSLI